MRARIMLPVALALPLTGVALAVGEEPRGRRLATVSVDATVLSAALTLAGNVSSHVAVGGTLGLGPPFHFKLSLQRAGLSEFPPAEAVSGGAFLRTWWEVFQFDAGARVSYVRYTFSSEGSYYLPHWGTEVGPYLFVCAGWERVKLGPRLELAFDLTENERLFLMAPIIVRWIL